jgi:hypothetical protein
MDYYDLDFPRRSEPKQSGFGIASFMIVMLVGSLEFAILVIAGIMEATEPGGIDEESPVVILLGVVMIGGLLLDIVGVALGIAGLTQRDRRKGFAVVGVVIGSLVFLGVLFILMVGLCAVFL